MQLADTSAWTTRHRRPTVQAAFDALVVRGEVAICDPVEFELLWTTRSAREFEVMRKRFAALPRYRTRPADWDRAGDVWQELVRRGRHRQVPHADLVIAAVAERAQLPVVHYDRHFELIAQVTGQPQRAIAPLGSL